MIGEQQSQILILIKLIMQNEFISWVRALRVRSQFKHTKARLTHIWTHPPLSRKVTNNFDIKNQGHLIKIELTKQNLKNLHPSRQAYAFF